MTMTFEMKSDISRQLTMQTALFKILFTLRLDVVFDDSSLFKSRDIYNLKAKLRREDLESLTLIQALMRELNNQNDDWISSFQKNARDQITHLFFIKESCQFILKINHEVLVLDCTYKINRYKMSLLIISDQTKLHINFYVAFCFMSRKKMSDYFWTLNQLKTLYARLKLSRSIVFVIDMKKDLMIARYLIFSDSNHLLCIWHINNNVLVNCKKEFNIKEAWKKFFSEWKQMMYASFDREFREIWMRFAEKYNLFHEDCIEYLNETYIESHRRRFVKAYTNEILHFETTMISRSENEHAQLKRHLRAFIDDLKTMMNSINLLFKNEIHDHLIEWAENKIRYSVECRKSIFHQLSAFVTSYAIKQMLSQLKLLTKRTIVISLCTDVFIKTMRLSCSYKMQKRFFQNESLLVENVHFHWR